MAVVNSSPAFYEELTPENAAMLLIDHQAGLFLGVQSMNQQILKNNAIALAKTAKVFNLPTVLFTSSAKGPNGPTIPEIVELFPDHEIHDRSPINLWNDPKCRAAVERTERKKLIMAAITTDVCLVFPALSALKAGYDVYAVIDASGTWSSAADFAAMLRLTQAGAIVTNWIAIAAELKHDEDRESTPAMNQTFGEHMNLYSFLGDIAAAKA
ncbi:MAG: isochorismatase family protein [Stenomitos rutilans HA7619-LM2]|jgi:nicotinamidase-related amidase|nr:isochorismatase family protein [Stenomitos rutilans HA7619-LM2]